MKWIVGGLGLLLALWLLVRFARRRWPRAAFVAGAVSTCVLFGACWWIVQELEAGVEWPVEPHPTLVWAWAGATLGWGVLRGLQGLFKIRAARQKEEDIDAWVAGTFLYFLPAIVAGIVYMG